MDMIDWSTYSIIYLILSSLYQIIHLSQKNKELFYFITSHSQSFLSYMLNTGYKVSKPTLLFQD